jgi:hypothetical protein
MSRKRFRDDQIRVLNDSYESNIYPSREEKLRLRDLTGLSAKEIDGWFNNKRNYNKRKRKYEQGIFVEGVQNLLHPRFPTSDNSSDDSNEDSNKKLRTELEEMKSKYDWLRTIYHKEYEKRVEAQIDADEWREKWEAIASEKYLHCPLSQINDNAEKLCIEQLRIEFEKLKVCYVTEKNKFENEVQRRLKQLDEAYEWREKWEDAQAEIKELQQHIHTLGQLVHVDPATYNQWWNCPASVIQNTANGPTKCQFACGKEL